MGPLWAMDREVSTILGFDSVDKAQGVYSNRGMGGGIVSFFLLYSSATICR